MTHLSKQLRQAALDIRKRPYPIKDLIPLLQQAADQLDNSKLKQHCQDFGRCNCTKGNCEYGLLT